MEEAKVLRIALESLQQQLSMLQKTLERLTEQNREMAEQNRQKDERIEELTQMLLNMQRARFGQRSEKSVYVLDDGTRQLSILNSTELAKRTLDKPKHSNAILSWRGYLRLLCYSLHRPRCSCLSI